MADEIRASCDGRRVFFRGLIEFSSFCKNDCYYCGLRKSNLRAARYRLSPQEVLDACGSGHRLGFRTFVLQSGEDRYFNDPRLCGLVRQIKEQFPDCAVTLSVGERSRDSYRALRHSGADRYLLRHESANSAHYRKLHPAELRLETRKRCLHDLKEIGFQVGAGFMVDSPGQTVETLAEDLIFLRELQPHMVGIGPFIPHRDTPFAGSIKPTADHTLIMLSLLRLMLPQVLLPATTALNTVSADGRLNGMRAGANVLMPNLSPPAHRRDYNLYDNKADSGIEAAEHLGELCQVLRDAGFTPDFSRGDHADFRQN